MKFKRSNPQCNKATVHDMQGVIKSSLRYSGDKNGGRKERRLKKQRVRQDVSEDSTEIDSE